jgi:phosphoglycolate phosphatase
MMKTIILDFDGTVGDTQRCIVSTIQLSLNRMGLPEAKEDEVIRLIGLPLVDMFRTLTDLDEPRLDEITKIYRDNFSDVAFGHVRSFPHVQDTIRQLYDSGCIVTIASSRGRQSLQMLMEQLHIDKYIYTYKGDQDVVEKKPAPEMVIKILNQTATAPEDALVVGDTVYDIEMGQRAGCRTCGVTYGNNSREQLQQQGADYIINDFADLLKIIMA